MQMHFHVEETVHEVKNIYILNTNIGKDNPE